MTLLLFFGAVTDIVILLYTIYFLLKVRYYPCINNKMGSDILKWSWVLVICGSIAGFMPYYSLRAILVGFDCTTILTTFVQFCVWAYGIKLFIFHIKTTRYERKTV